MDPKFFRKYADLVTEASAPAAPKKEARILEKLVWKTKIKMCHRVVVSGLANR